MLGIVAAALLSPVQVSEGTVNPVSSAPVTQSYDWKTQASINPVDQGTAVQTGSMLAGLPEDWQMD